MILYLLYTSISTVYVRQLINVLFLLFKAVEHCQEHVWKADFAPPKQVALGEAELHA